MAAIIPRWEWRTFGRRFGIAETRFAQMPPAGVQESDELYLLAGNADNIKVRDGLIDIKVLREVDVHGLERWEPVMKQGFPLAAADVQKVFSALRLAAPALDRDTYTLEQFFSELVAPCRELESVSVHKRRVRYKVGGCTAEVTELRADERTTRSLAIESEDAAAVLAALASVGLDSWWNVNYSRGLRALMDATPERYAVIDAGTNSIKFHIAEQTADGSMRKLVDRAEMTRLGEGLEAHGEIGADAIERAVDAIAGMVSEARKNGVLALAAVGTAGFRIARNSAEVIAAIRARTGVAIEVISGEEEGRLAYLAATAGLGLPESSLVVFDTGGGSSQFSFGSGTRVEERFSIDVGAVRYTDRFGLDNAVSEETLGNAMAAISADLSRIEGRARPDRIVAMGGGLTNMAAVKHALKVYDADIVQGTVLDSTEIDRQIALYRTSNAAQRRAIVGLQPKRAEVILAGACIVRSVMDKFRKDTLTVSDRGLRHRLVVERFGT